MPSATVRRLIPAELLRNTVQHEVASHAALLDRYGQHEVAALLYLFETQLIPEIEASLASRLGDRPPGLRTKQLEMALADVRRVIDRVIRGAGGDFAETMRRFAEDEAGFVRDVVSRFDEESNRADRILPGNVSRAAVSQPIFDRKLNDWFRDITVDTQRRVERAVTRGVILGTDTATILRQVRGDGTQRGVMQQTRAQALALVRTAVTQISNTARAAAFEQVGIEEYEWVATLDSRTCPICAPLDGKRFKIGKGPQPPAHPLCRCATAPVVDDILGEQAGAVRASEGGPTTASTYEEWLRQQPEQYQDAVLGQGKAAILRRGTVPFDSFVRRRTMQPVSYRELREIEERRLGRRRA